MLFRLKVISAQGDKVNINLPLLIAEVFLKSGTIKGVSGEANDLLSKIDFRQLISLVKLGTVGKIIDIQSAEGDIVEGWVE